MTTKQARGFCLTMLVALFLLLAFFGVRMAYAVNAIDQVPKLISRSTPADTAFIRGDTLFMNNMTVSVAALMKAVAVQTDTVRGSGTILGIGSDTVRVDYDSTGSLVTLTFGGYGGGLRWNRSTDKMQFSNDFSTWTDIGTGGSSTTNADSLYHIPAFIRPQTDGYVVKFDADGDSLYLSADATGAAGDSNAIIYETDRVGMYSDTGLYLGDVGDSTMLWYDLTSDNIKAYVILYYVDDISDSALMSKYWIESTVGDSLEANGFLTALNSSNGISGAASMNIVSIQLDPTFFAVGGDTVRIQNLNAGKLSFNVFGSPTDYDELVITENTLTTRTIGSWRVVYTNGSYQLAGATVGAANTVFVGNGTTSAPSFRALLDADIPDNITITETGDISSVVAGAGMTGGATSGAATVDAIGSWSVRVFADSIGVRAVSGDSVTIGTVADARIATTLLRDSEFTDSVNANRTHSGVWTISGNWVNTANPWADNEVANNLTVDDAGVAATIMRDSEFNDSIAAARTMANVVTITGNWVNTTNPWAVNEGGTGAATFTQNGILYGNATSAIGVTAQGASGTVLHGNGGTPTFSAVVSADITDGTIVAGDIATGTIDSVRLGTACVKPAELDTTGSFVVGNLRTGARTTAVIKSNNFQPTDSDSSLKIGGGGGLTIGSAFTLGTDITDDTMIVTLPAEWAGGVLSRGYGDDSTKYWDSLTIRGGSDSYGNYLEFAKLTDTTSSALRRRHMQIAIPVPMDADTIYDVALAFRVYDGAGGESTYVRLKWSTTPFDSTNAFKVAYTERDSSNSTTFDTLSAAYSRTAVSRGSKIYALVTGLLWDKHVTWIRCYDVIMTYHRRYL